LPPTWACPSDRNTALIDSLPSPCAQLSRARTTTKAPPVDRDFAGPAACRVFRSRRSARGSHVPVEDPRCGRWSALPLAALAVHRFGTRRAARRPR
jgi:hypothetical protein